MIADCRIGPNFSYGNHGEERAIEALRDLPGYATLEDAIEARGNHQQRPTGITRMRPRIVAFIAAIALFAFVTHLKAQRLGKSQRADEEVLGGGGGKWTTVCCT